MEYRAMSNDMVDVMLHIDETLPHSVRESLREKFLAQEGVLAAANHDDHPHLMVIEYDPEVTSSSEFIALANEQGVHAELIGL
jgi:hypothetical protein